MIQPGGFVDLRAPTGSEAAEDSVWPSFTDIMTVIVMIFLMALVVILIRNVDLVRQLRLTIELEQEAAAQSDTAALRVATLGDEIAALELRLGETDARRLHAESTAADGQQKISTLLGNIAALEQVRERLNLANTELTSSKDTLQGELLSMEEKQQALESLGAELKIEVAALALERETLVEDSSSLTAENTSLRQQLESSSLERQQLTEAAKNIATEREQYRAESTALGKQNLTLEQKLAELISLKAVLEQRIESLGDKNITLEGERSDLVNRSSGLNQKLSALTKFQAQLEAQVTSLASAVAELEEEKSHLLRENRDTTAWLATLLGLKQSLEKDQARLKVKLAESKAGRTELEANRLVLERKVSALIERRSSLEREKAGLIDEAKILETEMLEQEGRSRADIKTLTAAKSRLEEETINLRREANILQREKAVALEDHQRVSGDLAESEERYRLTKAELELLRFEYTDEVAAFKAEREIQREELDILRARNTEIEYEYNRLMRPERSRKGRHVVWVRQTKDEKGIRYSLADPDTGPHTELPAEQFYMQLNSLKKKYGEKLYTKITHKGDTLTHNEATKFSSFIRCQFDYYDPAIGCIKP